MIENGMVENRFRVDIRGDKQKTIVVIHAPTFWFWVLFALTLASRFPALWDTLQDILQNGPF